jgi:hypothetical protein
MCGLKKVMLVCAVLFIASCSRMLVTHDYEKGTNFSAYKTYGWHPIERSIELNDLLISRVKDAVNRELELKGFILAPEQPDFSIAIHFATRQKLDITDWGYATGGYWDRGYGFGLGGRLSSSYYEEGTLMIDMVDGAENKLVWRGTATDIIAPGMSPEERTKEINSAVLLILQKFPPFP